jgi:hypothetical protein
MSISINGLAETIQQRMCGGVQGAYVIGRVYEEDFLVQGCREAIESKTGSPVQGSKLAKS